MSFMTPAVPDTQFYLNLITVIYYERRHYCSRPSQRYSRTCGKRENFSEQRQTELIPSIHQDTHFAWQSGKGGANKDFNRISTMAQGSGLLSKSSLRGHAKTLHLQLFIYLKMAKYVKAENRCDDFKKDPFSCSYCWGIKVFRSCKHVYRSTYPQISCVCGFEVARCDSEVGGINVSLNINVWMLLERDTGAVERFAVTNVRLNEKQAGKSRFTLHYCAGGEGLLCVIVWAVTCVLHTHKCTHGTGDSPMYSLLLKRCMRRSTNTWRGIRLMMKT